MDGTPVAPAICYESIYGDFMSAYASRRTVYCYPTNDGWWEIHQATDKLHELRLTQSCEFRKVLHDPRIPAFPVLSISVVTSFNKAIGGKDALQQTLLKTISELFMKHGDYIGL